MVAKMARIVPATHDYFLEQIKKSGLWYSKIIKDEKISPDILKLLDKTIIEAYQIMPVDIEIEKSKNNETENNETEIKRLILVTDQHQSFKNSSFFEDVANMPVKIMMCDPENIKQGIFYHYNFKSNPIDNDSYSDMEMDENDSNDTNKSIIREYVEKILITAINENASDIHFLPGDNGTYVVLKIDGQMIDFSKKFKIEKKEKIYLVNVIKTMCDPPMDGQALLPDDGSIKFRKNNSKYDFRVSTMPTIRGQKVVIRLLNNNQVPLDLEQLGFTAEDIKAIKKSTNKASGLFIVSGPVGTGKSTTIHAALKRTRGLHHNIITIENPVEHRDELLTQIEMRLEGDERTRLDGDVIFDSILRQDPKTIFWTETRNRKDASQLITACLSGHRIMTTLHATDAIESLYRLFNMGVNRFDLVRQINGILSQRLLVLNCPECAQPYTPPEEDLQMLSDKEIEYILSGNPKKGVGCPACIDGYKNRIVVAESIVFNNSFRDFILYGHKGIREIQIYLKENMGFKSMWEKGLDLVYEGKVTLFNLLDVLSSNE